MTATPALPAAFAGLWTVQTCHGHARARGVSEVEISKADRIAKLRGWLGRSGWLWIVSTPLVLGWFAATTDSGALMASIKAIPISVAGISLLLLLVNASLEVIWLNVVLRDKSEPGRALGVVGWHMLASSLLPGRLGDLAWIFLMRDRFGVSAARAAFVAVFHRTQDMVCMILFFFAFLILAGPGHPGALALMALAGLFVLALAAIVRIEWLLAVAGRLAHGIARRGGGRAARWVMRQALQTRVWYRREISLAVVSRAFAIILLRWVLVLGALLAPLVALAPQLGWDTAPFVASAYVLMGTIPIQTVGGYGTGEAGLASLLSIYGLPLAAATAVGLVLRSLINIGNVVFWALAMVLLSLCGWPAGAVRSPPAVSFCKGTRGWFSMS